LRATVEFEAPEPRGFVRRVGIGYSQLRTRAISPVLRKQATRNLALEAVGYTPALPGDEVCDFSFGLPPTRLIHSVKDSVKDAPQNADLLLDRLVHWKVATNVRG
jgi:hypothetical protein